MNLCSLLPVTDWQVIYILSCENLRRSSSLSLWSGWFSSRTAAVIKIFLIIIFRLKEPGRECFADFKRLVSIQTSAQNVTNLMRNWIRSWSELRGAQFSIQLGIGWFIFWQVYNLFFQAFLIKMVYDAVLTNNPQGLNWVMLWILILKIYFRTAI